MGMNTYNDFASVFAEDSESFGIFFLIYLIAMLVSLVFFTVIYVLQSVGFYSIAKRRGIHHPWLAWIPVGNMWILGSISDQFQFVAKGRVKNRRKTLLGLQIAMTVCTILFFTAAILLGIFAAETEMSGATVGVEAVAPAIAIVAVYFALTVIAIVMTVFQYIACYDLFVSCSPNNGVLFLVLSILINITLPFFIFALRNKDGGMPPRRTQVPVAPWTPAPPPPAPEWQQPVAPAPVEENLAAEEDFAQQEESQE